MCHGLTLKLEKKFIVLLPYCQSSPNWFICNAQRYIRILCTLTDIKWLLITTTQFYNTIGDTLHCLGFIWYLSDIVSCWNRGAWFDIDIDTMHFLHFYPKNYMHIMLLLYRLFKLIFKYKYGLDVRWFEKLDIWIEQHWTWRLLLF